MFKAIADALRERLSRLERPHPRARIAAKLRWVGNGGRGGPYSTIDRPDEIPGYGEDGLPR